MKIIDKLLFGFGILAMAFSVDSCGLTDTEYIEPEPGITRLDVSPLSVKMGYADEVTLLVAVRPGNAEYVWTSSDPSVATVDENNRIVPKGIGSVELTCTAGNFKQTVPVEIHSSIVLESSYTYLNLKEESTLDCVKIYPEGVGFIITSSDASVVKVPSASEQKVTAVAAGEAVLTIKTDDGISAKLNVGVLSGTVISTATASAYYYDGGSLGHVGYGISALALAPSTALYKDGGVWEGTGKAVFLKVFMPFQSDFAEVPEGVYTQGTAENNFYPDDSYIIDVATGVKTPITAGEVSITKSGVTGYVTAGSEHYAIECSGALTNARHEYPFDEMVYDYTEADFSEGLVYVDHYGKAFYGGYGNVWCWQMPFADAANSMLQLVIISKQHDDPHGTYKASPEFFVNNTLVCMGWGWTSQFAGANIQDGEITVSDCDYDMGAGADFVVASFSGELRWDGEMRLPAINETHRLPAILKLNAKNLKFKLQDFK